MAGGQETRGQVSEGLSADGRGPTQSVREHRDTGEGAWGESPQAGVGREGFGGGFYSTRPCSELAPT